MSLGIVFKGSEGIVLAADSRVTIFGGLPLPVPPGGIPAGTPTHILLPATYDNATKLLSIKSQTHVAAVTYGTGAIGLTDPRTAHSLLPEFEAGLTAISQDRLKVKEFADKLSDFFVRQWNNLMPQGIALDPMIFLVGGYDENEPYGKIYQFVIPSDPNPVQQHVNDFGIQFGGQREITERIINGFDSPLLELLKTKFSLNDAAASALAMEFSNASGSAIPYQLLPLQDCVDLCILLVRTTAQLLDYQVKLRGVGGAIDVATITRQEGFRPIQRKELRGQRDRA